MTKKTQKPKTAKKTKAEKPLSERINRTLQIMDALQREEGATIDELVEMTGWQPHSARGFLSNMRKKLKEKGEDSQIAKYTRDGKTMYKLEAKEKADG